MPKAPARKASSSTSKSSKSSTKKSYPYPQPSDKEDSKKPSSKKDAKSPKDATPAKDPKASHLYTDDNPSTTLPGTGFKDASAAEKTLSLVSPRSLTYQFQTINTMYHRAKGHAHRTPDMDAAIAVFETWLKQTYPAAKASQRDFKPVLSKKIVGGLLDKMKGAKGMDTSFAEVYVELEPRKRLANTLVDEGRPGGEDWDVRRYKRLCEMVKEGEEMGEEELWEGEDAEGGPTLEHLKLIAWAWSPESERKLQGRVGKS
ncbi:MAG: hypothetical protein Q9160_005543 [Pyrenula sp. 1 TL-2023]